MCLALLTVLINYSMMSNSDLTFLTHFMPLISFDNPLKTSENLWFSDVIRGYQKRSVACNGLTNNFKGIQSSKENKVNQTF